MKQSNGITVLNNGATHKIKKMENNTPTRKGIEKCAEWLSYCLKIGWEKDQLDALENIYWKFRDGNGELKPLLEEESQEDIFREFIRTHHLTSTWEIFIKSRTNNGR